MVLDNSAQAFFALESCKGEEKGAGESKAALENRSIQMGGHFTIHAIKKASRSIK